jgi:hypothetical protein
VTHRIKSRYSEHLRNNALLTRLNSRGRFRDFISGGRTILEEIAYQGNSTYTRYSGYQVINIAPSTSFTSAEYPIRQAAVSVSISGLEELQNSGREQSIALLDSRMERAEEDFKNGLSFDVYSDGTLPNQIGGLQAAVPFDPTVGTYGGIDRAAWDFWRNQRFRAITDGGAALSPANVYQYMTQLYVRCIRGNDRPDLIVTDNNGWTVYNQSLHAIQRITNTDSDVGKAGFMNLKFMDTDVVLDGAFQGTAGQAASSGVPIGGVPASTMWFLNSRFISWRPHRDRNIEPLNPDRFSVNQDAMVRIQAWAGNMTLRGALFQGVLTNT